MSKPRIEIYVDGRRAITTDMAAELGPWRDGAAVRTHISRKRIKPVAALNPKTKLYLPEALDLELPAAESPDRLISTSPVDAEPGQASNV